MKTKIIILSLGFIALLALGFNTAKTGVFSPEADSNNAENPETGTAIGNTAPELAYKNPEGEIMKLEDLRGKVVLLDFWASWCGPCRHENPNIVETYNTYKDKEFTKGSGFTVYGVSLDQEKSAWMDAIEKDNLSWDYHVSDLNGWRSEAAEIYGVQAIPSNFLLSGEGVIIGKNLRGNALKKALEEITQ